MIVVNIVRATLLTMMVLSGVNFFAESSVKTKILYFIAVIVCAASCIAIGMLVA